METIGLEQTAINIEAQKEADIYRRKPIADLPIKELQLWNHVFNS
jgi:hypothetical protein